MAHKPIRISNGPATTLVIHGDHGNLFSWNLHQTFGHQIRDLNLVLCLGKFANEPKIVATHPGATNLTIDRIGDLLGYKLSDLLGTTSKGKRT
jgi:hypothetical protein